MDRLFIGALVGLLLTGALAGAVVALGACNAVIWQALERDFGGDLMAQCEGDGLAECHLEADFDGLVITGVEAVGKEVK